MKCNECGADATAVCKFCGRAVCGQHTLEESYPSGYPRAAFSRRKHAILIQNAVWCGTCRVERRVGD